MRFASKTLLSALLATFMLGGCKPNTDSEPQTGAETNSAAISTNAPPAAQDPPYSAAAAGIVSMVGSGMPEINIRNQIFLAQAPYNLTADELARMATAGVPQNVIAAILQHDAQLLAEARRLRTARTQAVARVADNAQLRRDLDNARLALQRERLAAQPAVNQARNAAPVPNIDIPPQARGFYQALQPYGSWVRHRQYGLVWQPTVAINNRTWQPYADNGRWLVTDQGWYWHSEYSWGWAAFHYGRWGYSTTGGWYWVPDTVWGPSWVTFRMNGSHVGWAPLPPGAIAVPNRGMVYNGRNVGGNFHYGLSASHYSFVPSEVVFARSLRARMLSRTRIQPFFRDTAVINNIIIGNNNTVINHGAPLDRFTRRTQLTVQRSRIQAAPNYNLTQFGRLANNTVYRPSLQHIAPVKPAVWSTGTSTQSVLLPASATPDTVIAGRPVVDHSTGVPVVTSYTTAPERRRPTIVNNVIVGSNNTVTSRQPQTTRSTRPNSSTPVGGVLAPSTALQNARNRGFFNQNSPGFTPAMPQSPPVPIMSTPQPLGVGLQPTTHTNATRQSGFRFNPNSQQYHFNNRQR